MIWRNEKRRLDELKPAKYNPRKLSAKAKADLAESIDRFDLVDPLVINANGTIIGGHQRFGLLRDRGVVEVDVRVPERELNEVEEKELNLRLNKNTGEFDMSLLTEFDPAMLVNVGFEGDFVDQLFDKEIIEDDFDGQNEYDKIIQPITITGDIYELGNHRLVCGDSTLVSTFEKLFAGGGQSTNGFYGSAL